MKRIILIIFIAFFINNSSAQAPETPSFEDVISLKSVANEVISPDGKHIVYVSQSVDWKENRYDRELWLSKNRESPFQITNTLKNSSTNPKWSPDSKWIAFLSNRGGKTQIHALRLAGGEIFSDNENLKIIFLILNGHPMAKKSPFFNLKTNLNKKKNRKKNMAHLLLKMLNLI